MLYIYTYSYYNFLGFIYYEFACLLDMFDVAEPEEGGMEVMDL